MHSRLVPSKVTEMGFLLNHDALVAREPARGTELRDWQRPQHRLAFLPEASKGPLLTRLVEVPQICEVAGCKVRDPLIQVAHAGIVEQLKAVAACFPFVSLQFGQFLLRWVLLHFVADLPGVLGQVPLYSV